MTRTQKARIVLENPKHRLAPGMFASVEIAPSAPAAQDIVIPSEALIATGTRNVVIVDSGDGHFRAQEVLVGAEAGGKTAVLEGLHEGESIVLSGQFLIDSEASLSGTLARLQDARPAAPSSSPGNAPLQHQATGKVERIEGRRWTIATEPIASLGMGAMTMTFVRPATVPAPEVRPGQRIRFSFFHNAAGEFEIGKIAPPDEAHAEMPKEQRP
jgi:Cu(I)/Ag(I) efflux system membrane fusion protein